MQRNLRALAILFALIVLCSAVVVLAGGVSFVLRPVGAIYLILWIAWLLVVAPGRERGVSSSYDRSVVVAGRDSIIRFETQRCTQK